MRSTPVVAGVALLWGVLCVLGCESVSVPAAEQGELVVSLSAELTAADLGKASTVRLRLYESVPATPADAPVFDSDCLVFQSVRQRIENLDVGASYYLRIDLYDDDACTVLRFRGQRGGIEVVKGANAAPYYVHMVEVDALTPLPGVAREHFPLNMSRPRAFHTATPLDDGRILIIGGAESVQGSDVLIAGSNSFEVFDTRTMLFDHVSIPSFPQRRMMAHGATMLPGGGIAFAGGVEAMRLGIRRPDGSDPLLTFEVPERVCYDAGCDTPNFVQLIYVAELGGAAPLQVPLTTARVFPSLDVVRRPTGDVLLLAGGVPGEDGLDGFDATGCEINADGGLAGCDFLRLESARAGHATACARADADGVCTGLYYMAGASGAFAEWIGGGLGEFKEASLVDAPSGSGWLLPKAAGGDLRILVAGGARNGSVSSQQRGEMGLLQVSDVGDGTYMTIDTASWGLPDVAGLLFHTMTRLGDGRVLLAGGLTPDLTVFDRVLVLRLEADGVELESMRVLTEPRFGHTATLITQGPLEGAVVLLGGLTVDGDGQITVAETSEIFFPEDGGGSW